MRTAPWQYYDLNAERFFRDYEALNFAKIHRAFLPYLPRQSGNCLDIGAGSGRDAMALAKRGYKVTAVEPSDSLRRLAIMRHAHPNIQWLRDHLPQLTQVKALNKKFEFILLSAVWMHVHPNERDQALSTLSELLAAEGCIALTIRLGLADNERVMYAVTVEELIRQARRYGLNTVYAGRSTKDAMHRSAVTWRKIIFKKMNLITDNQPYINKGGLT